MTSVYKSQTDFSGGEISPRLSGRSDSKRYQTGLELCENWIVTPQGSILMRDGTKYIGEASSSESVRLIPFQRANKEDYVVELSAPIGTDPGKVRVWTREGQVDFTNVKNNLIQNGKFTNGFDGLDGWALDTGNVPAYGKSTLQARGPHPRAVESGWAELVSTAHTKNDDAATHRRVTTTIKQRYEVPVGVTEVELKFTTKRLVIRPEQGYVSEDSVDGGIRHSSWYVGNTVGSRQVNYEYSVGTAEGLKDLHNTVHIEDDSYPPVQDDDYIGLGKKSALIDTTGLSEIWIQFESRVQYIPWPGHTSFNQSYFLDGISIGEISLVDTNIVEDGVFEIDHPWSAEDLDGIQYAHETADERVVLASSSQPPQEIRLDPDDGKWDFAPVPIIGPPSDWGPNNYPMVVEIFQSRLWFAAINSDLARVWASTVGELNDFDIPDIDPAPPVVDTDPIDLNIAARGVIQWMRGMSSNLLIGTDEGEHVMTSSTGALTPSDIQVNPASSNGSASIQSEPISDEIMYVSNDRRKLRAISFTDGRKNWTSVDITFLAEHISKAKIKRIANLKNPNYQIAMLLEDGNWIQCSYDRETGTIAFHRHSTPPDKVKSMTSVTNNDGSVLWLAVQRDVSVSGVIEKRIYLEVIEAQDVYRVHMDSWVSRVANDPDGIIEDGGEYFAINLEHLEGREVFLSEDGGNGGLHEVENGRIPISSSLVKEAIIGLQFTARAKLLPVELGDPGDSIQSAKQRRVQLYLRLVDSAIPRVNGKLAPVRGGASIMDDKEPNLTDDIKYVVTNWSRGSSVEITQDLPYRTEIVAVIGKTKTNRS